MRALHSSHGVRRCPARISLGRPPSPPHAHLPAVALTEVSCSLGRPWWPRKSPDRGQLCPRPLPCSRYGAFLRPAFVSVAPICARPWLSNPPTSLLAMALVVASLCAAEAWWVLVTGMVVRRGIWARRCGLPIDAPPILTGPSQPVHTVVSLCPTSCILCRSSISYSPQRRRPLSCPGYRARCCRLWWSASSTVDSVNSHLHSLLFCTSRERDLGNLGKEKANPIRRFHGVLRNAPTGHRRQSHEFILV
jgi:hypothetical protein